MCKKKRAQSTCKIRDLAKLIGSLVALFPGAQYGPLHYRKLEKLKCAELSKHKGNFDRHAKLSEDINEELDWWIENVPHTE